MRAVQTMNDHATKYQCSVCHTSGAYHHLPVNVRHIMDGDRIGAGGITATQLQADAAKTRQDAVDAKLASWLNAEADTYDSDGLLRLHHDG